MQPDPTNLLKRIDLAIPPIGFYDAPESVTGHSRIYGNQAPVLAALRIGRKEFPVQAVLEES